MVIQLKIVGESTLLLKTPASPGPGFCSAKLKLLDG